MEELILTVTFTPFQKQLRAHMSPCLEVANPVSGAYCDAELSGENIVGNPLALKASQFAHQSIGHLGVFLIYSAKNLISFLGKHVARVFGGCSKKKMTWVNTDGVVAFMADTDTPTANFGACGMVTGRNLPMMYHPRCAMGRHSLLLENKLPMTIIENSPNPRPAIAGVALGNLGPKPGEKRCVVN